jgi:hypothetical protein
MCEKHYDTDYPTWSLFSFCHPSFSDPSVSAETRPFSMCCCMSQFGFLYCPWKDPSDLTPKQQPPLTMRSESRRVYRILIVTKYVPMNTAKEGLKRSAPTICGRLLCHSVPYCSQLIDITNRKHNISPANCTASSYYIIYSENCLWQRNGEFHAVPPIVNLLSYLPNSES